MESLHRRHSQILAFHFLAFTLKVCKEVWNSQSCGKFAHKKVDLYDTVSRPYLTISFCCLIESESFGYHIQFHEIEKESF